MVRVRLGLGKLIDHISIPISYCKPLGRYLCWWMVRSSPRISSAQYQFLSAEVDTAVLTLN